MTGFEIAQTSWNLELARFAKEFLFDASFFVLLTAVSFVACQGRFAGWFRPVGAMVALLFMAVCASGTASLLAQPLLDDAARQDAESEKNGCREKANVLVVLSGGAVSAELPLVSSSLRVLEAARFLKKTISPGIKENTAPQAQTVPKKTVVLSGGPASPGVAVAETVPMDHLLRLELGDKASFVQIILEDKSKNTFQNALFTKQLIDKKGMLKNILLVTSALHMPRSAGTFRRAGFTVCTLSAPSPEVLSPGFVSFANGARLMGVLNEYAGRWGYAARGWL